MYTHTGVALPVAHSRSRRRRGCRGGARKLKCCTWFTPAFRRSVAPVAGGYGDTWSNAPAGTQSFTIQMYDADSPAGAGRWLWLVYNISATTTSIPANAGVVHSKLLPAGAVQVSTDLGTEACQGPCPPSGRMHRCYLRVVALKVPRPDVPKDATAAYLTASAGEQALGATQLLALFVPARPAPRRERRQVDAGCAANCTGPAGAAHCAAGRCRL